MINRRDALKFAAAGAVAAPLAACGPKQDASKLHADDKAERSAKIHAARHAPVVRRELFSDPVIIEDVQLLRTGDQYFVQIRSKDGATGIALCQPERISNVVPLLLNRVIPFFKGKDARDWDALMDGVFKFQSNYKWQGLAYWVCVAWVEFAVLDLLGKTLGVPAGDLIGKRLRDRSGIYYANGDRTSSASEVVDILEGLIAKSGARAVKYKLGARMHYTDASTARDKEIIPLARERLGDDATIFVDSNSSYDVPLSIEIGKILQEYKYDFFEEPVQFDHIWETKEVNDALDIPIAGGEQESSLRRFEWMIDNDALDIVQPDLLYFGGLTRSIRVARMADAVGKLAVPHMSPAGLGSMYVLHFASVVPNALDYMEYKGADHGVPYEIPGNKLGIEAVDGGIDIPTAPGLGVVFDPDYLAKTKPVTL